MEEVERGGASKEIYFRTSEGITELSTAPSGAAKYAAVSCAATMCARESSVCGCTRSTFRKPIFDVFIAAFSRAASWICTTSPSIFFLRSGTETRSPTEIGNELKYVSTSACVFRVMGTTVTIFIPLEVYAYKISRSASAEQAVPVMGEALRRQEGRSYSLLALRKICVL